MCVETTIINEFSKYSSWLNTLEDMEETLWSKPIAKGKWSVSGVLPTKRGKHTLREIKVLKSRFFLR